MILLSLIALLLFGASLGLVARAVVLPRLKTAQQVEHVGLYGFDAGPALAVETADGTSPLLAVADRIGGGASRLFGRFDQEKLRRELIAAGLYRLTPRALLGIRVLLASVFALIGMAMIGEMPVAIGVMFAVLTTAIAWLLPLVLVRRRARFRLEAIDRELPELIDLMVVTVEAGMGLAGALQMSATKLRGPLAGEIRLVLQEQRMGRAMSEALMGLLQRADTPSTRSFTRSIVQGETLGVSIGTIMRGLAEEMRKRRRQYAEERAQKAPTKMLFPLVLLILPAFMLVALGPAIFGLLETLGGR